MLNIYGFQSFNTLKVLLTAEELGLQYQYHGLNPMKGEHKTPEHFKRHPLGKTPAIEHDGRPLFESNTICRYLASFQNSPLYPSAPAQAWERAQIDQWVDYVTQHPGRWIGTYFFQEVVAKMIGEQTDTKAVKEAQEFLDQQLPVLEKQLDLSKYLAGSTATIADTVAFSYLTVSEITAFEFSKYPNLTRWYGEFKNRPSYARAMKHFGK